MIAVELGPLTVEVAPGPGMKWKLLDLDNYYSGAPVRTDIVDNPLGDGAFMPGPSRRSAKRMALRGLVHGGTEEEAIEDAWEVIAALFPEGQSEDLYVTDARGRRRMQVWLRDTPEVLPFRKNAARFIVPLVAVDPRKYGPTVSDSIAPSGVASADGLQWPLFDDGYLSFGAFSPTGALYITNEGKARSWPTFTARGSLTTGFRVTSGSDVLEYAAAVPAGSEVLLSPYAGGRAFIGDVDVTQNLTRADWPSIGPGETRFFVFTPISTSSSAARLTADFAPAWW